MSLQRIWIPSPNYNSGRSRNQLVVLHTTEGAKDFRSLGSFLTNPNAGVSAHVGIDDTPGQIGEYLRRDRRAWAAFKANDWGVHAEICAFARWTRAEWLQHPTMLDNARQWVAEETAFYGIPNVRIGAADIRAGTKGVCGHKDCTDAGAGGDHWDPGPNFPWDVVVGGSAPIPGPVTQPQPQPQPSGNVPPFPGAISQGSTGQAVRQFQQRLHDRGWPIGVDGSAGPQTIGILRQYQQEKGLTVDGIGGQQTWNSLWTTPIA